jgi:hypothetical protein
MPSRPVTADQAPSYRPPPVRKGDPPLSRSAREAYARRWRGVWAAALAEMESVGTWSAVMRPMLEDYVEGWRVAADHRAEALGRPFSHSAATDRDFAHPGFASADREAKRAAGLAERLGLTRKAQRALGLIAEGKAPAPAPVADPFERLDELASRRAAADG